MICNHTPMPSLYMARLEWMEEMYLSGYEQKQCPNCQLWAIWVKKEGTQCQEKA